MLQFYFSLLESLVLLFRTDQLKRQYTGALCGLGYNPATGESLYYDHDVELVFDTLITQEDLDSVSTTIAAPCSTLSLSLYR